MKLAWVMSGERPDHSYTATGMRGTYHISLDKVADRYMISVDDRKRVEDVYYAANAKRIAQVYENNSVFTFPPDLRPRPDGGVPRVLPTDRVDSDTTAPLPQPPRVSLSAYVTGSRRMSAECREPDLSALAVKLQTLVTATDITPEKAGTPWLPWQSAVYALIDCVFSSQSDYNGVVLPLLRRLDSRPSLRDQPGLRFSAFLVDVDGFGEDKFECYATQVLTRNKIAGRLKVEICYEAATFLARRGLETMADLHKLGANLEPLVLESMQDEIHGIGPALAHYLLTLFGDEDHVKLDVMINRFWARMNDWCPRPSHEGDYKVVLATFRDVAGRMGSTPARLDNAIWRYESSRAR